ncbi:PREDICTED: myosin ID heavy chain-like [Vollenhovia emeryi]|uniref:myosin ID heavy chain-like n=1 Tax=Vollenhovia emeryi TaxID=411798 RepID=UPI0005F3C185|nr:PREDICTED: myosin ID heavy chain-like [Vollenhovia emeryi]
MSLEPSWSYISDAMGDLSAVPQEKTVDYLLERLERGQIYTWLGTFLLAVNPHGEFSIENLYDLSRAHEYGNACDVTLKEVPPHIFAVAARAHYRIVQGLGKPSQVILFSGETGTGKTFNAWKALEFLTRSVSRDTLERRGEVCNFLPRISNACRLISAFTTATTVRNQVTSRHVQLVWLEYKMGGICGATISSYLLERDRVTRGGCNFQIFAQMMTAAASEEFADLMLSTDRRYAMLSDLDPRTVQESRADFHETTTTMDMLGFTEVQKKDIFLILSLLLHMGDIQFVQEDDHCSIDTDDQQSREALENTCRLACVDEEDVAELLTSTLINPQSTRRRHSACRRNLKTSDACRYRLHSIIRHLYDLLFCWLINFVNEILSARLYSERLGMMDIFGFECFNSNGIEQLCINYVNERLQQYFVKKYLVSYRDELQKEGLIDDEESLEIAQRLYADRIRTLENYLFTTLNDTCLSTVPNNLFTLIKLVSAKSCSATRRVLHVRDENFVVRHFNGTVKYSIRDLLSKNTDKIPDELTVTFSVSKNKFLYTLINMRKPYHDGRAKKPTMLAKLRCNVDLLIEELDKCDTHYVRCIKPQRLNGKWDRDGLHKQLANTGVLEALPLARSKYPIHFVYRDFFKRYSRRRICSSTETCDLRTACKTMLESLRITMDADNSVHCGKRLIFLRESMFLRLESARRRYHAECVKKIEFFWLKYRKYVQQSIKENVPDDIPAIGPVNTNIRNELIKKSQSEHVVPMSGTNASVEKRQPQDTKDNMANNAETIGTVSTRSEQSPLERSLLEYENILPIDSTQDYVRGASKRRVNLLTKLIKKSAYILHWLDGISAATNTENIKPSLLEQLRESHNYNQSDDASCSKETQSQDAPHKSSNNNKLRKRNSEMTADRYDEAEDMYVIQYETFTLFYKSGVLSRRRPAKLPIGISIRRRSERNSHYMIHPELPQGIQDCL